MNQAAYILLLLSAFTTPFSLPAARALLAASAVVCAARAIGNRRRPLVPRVVWLGALFLAVAVSATVFGVNPHLGVPKLHKLMWWIGIPVATALVTSPRRLGGVLFAVASGTGVLALETLIRNPAQAARALRAGGVPDFKTALIHAGSMTDAQRLMIGVLLALGFLFAARRSGRGSAGWIGMLALTGLALLLNFKRGAWLGALGGVAVLVAANTRWRYLLVLAAVVMCLLPIPPVRTRIAEMKDEWLGTKGGRRVMWCKVAPALIREHPLGVGVRSLTNRMMRRIAPEVEPNRDHLHSNIAQVLVETGWIGLGLCLIWLTLAVSDAAAYLRRMRGRGPDERLSAQLLLLTLVALLGNGLVEYNLGDAEIVLIYGLLMGSAAALRRWAEAALPSETSSVPPAFPA